MDIRYSIEKKILVLYPTITYGKSSGFDMRTLINIGRDLQALDHINFEVFENDNGSKIVLKNIKSCDFDKFSFIEDGDVITFQNNLK